jgi:hypothetical protein
MSGGAVNFPWHAIHEFSEENAVLEIKTNATTTNRYKIFLILGHLLKIRASKIANHLV